MSGVVWAVGDAPTVTKMNYPMTLLHRSETAIGNVGTGEDDLHTYSVPAATLATNGDRLLYQALVQFAANANNKRLRGYFGSTLILDIGTVTYNNLYGRVLFEIIRTGAASQYVFVEGYVSGQAAAISAAFPTETLSGALTLKLTSDSTATDDIRQVASAVYFVTPRD